MPYNKLYAQFTKPFLLCFLRGKMIPAELQSSIVAAEEKVEMKVKICLDKLSL